MHHRPFARRGFQAIRESGEGRLMCLSLHQASIHVEPLSPTIPTAGGRQVEVSRSCPVGASRVLALRKVAAELGNRVAVKEAPADLESLSHYGVADGVFVNGKARFFGPVTEEAVRRAILEELPSQP